LSLETVVLLIFCSPFVAGIVAAIFDRSNNITPIIIDHGPSQPAEATSEKRSECKEEFLYQKTIAEEEQETKLEESEEALEILQEITNEEIQPVSVTHTYQPSELPDELNNSINELFKAIEEKSKTDDTTTVNRQNGSGLQRPQSGVSPDIPEENAQAVQSYEDFEATVPNIDDTLDQLSSGAKINNFPNGDNHPLPPREYWALEQKYGSEVISKVTTTPGIGGTGDYDCMIGRVIRGDNFMLLQYGDHYIPLKGMVNHEGVFLVEGMFVKPDLFFVNKYTNLDKEQYSVVRVAEN